MTYAESYGAALEPGFFGRAPDAVAHDLIGAVVQTRVEGQLTAGIIVETEGYFGPEDPGSHAATKSVTPRNAVMYGPPGSVFVYFTYGNHFMLNFVCEQPGTAAAVLIRALEPVRGVETMSVRRSGRSGAELTNGPGKLAQALGVDLTDNGVMLGEGRIDVYAGVQRDAIAVASSGRIGLTEGFEPELRYYVVGNPFVSPGKPGPLRRPSRRPSN